MGGVVHRLPVKAGEIDGSFTSRPAENFQAPFDADLFGDCARRAWGANADAKIAAIAGYSDRAARDVLSGLVGPPGNVLAALFVDIARRPPRRKRNRVARRLASSVS